MNEFEFGTGDYCIEFQAKGSAGDSIIRGADLLPTEAHKELAKQGEWLSYAITREFDGPVRMTVTCPTPDGLRLRKIVSEGDRIISDELIPVDDWIA